MSNDLLSFKTDIVVYIDTLDTQEKTQHENESHTSVHKTFLYVSCTEIITQLGNPEQCDFYVKVMGRDTAAVVDR